VNNILETIAVTLFLLLGLNAFSITHAASDTPTREDVLEVCPVSGQVILTLNGNIKNGVLVGWINHESVSWTVYAGRVTGFVNGQSIALIIRPQGNEFILTGWIGTGRVRWLSFGHTFNEYIHCH
jgi:hypothetical protein